MCVTNTTHRRAQAISLNTAQLTGVPSVLSQRLLGGFPSSVPTIPVKAASTVVVPSPPSSEYVSTVSCEKTRPKRRRKPQKPGKTAKLNDRHFVVHDYHDHANDGVDVDDDEMSMKRRGGVAVAFPVKLHTVLDQVEADGLAHIVAWQPHGRCFVIHNPKEFVNHIMPRYFRQSKLTSFQRQLNLYGFSRLTRGPDAGGYYHELFLRGKMQLCKKMSRTKVKGTKFKAASSPENEPDFYSMKPIVVSPHNSSDEEMSHHSGGTHETLTNHAHMMQQRHMADGIVQNYSFDPLPLQYEHMQPMTTAFSNVLSMPSLPYQRNPSYVPAAPPCEVDRIFDEAVDELFLDDGVQDLSEFVQDWDPTANMQAVEDDAQLGFLLEKLLEE